MSRRSSRDYAAIARARRALLDERDVGNRPRLAFTLGFDDAASDRESDPSLHDFDGCTEFGCGVCLAHQNRRTA